MKVYTADGTRFFEQADGSITTHPGVAFDEGAAEKFASLADFRAAYDAEELVCTTVDEMLDFQLGVGDTLDFADFPADSYCGQVSQDIIDKALVLLAACDPHPQIIEHIKSAARMAVSIVCFG